MGMGIFGVGLIVTVLSDSTSDDRPFTAYHGDKPVVYQHKQLRLRALSETVSPGGTIKFRIINVGDSSITLGCNNPWTIQKSVEGQWRDGIWTSAEGYNSCASPLLAGKSTTVSVTLSQAALETQTEEVRLELNPGQYRFVLLSTDPFLAANFRVRSRTASKVRMTV